MIDTQSTVMIIICIATGFGALVKYIVYQQNKEMNEMKRNFVSMEERFRSLHEKRVSEIYDAIKSLNAEIKDLRNCMQHIKQKMGEIDGRLKSVGDYHESLRLVMLNKRD